MKTERETLIAAYDGFNRRDIDAVLRLLQPDVDWANGMEGGRMRRRSAVREYWTRQWEAINSRVEPMNFGVENDGRICVTVHAIVRDLAENIVHDSAVEHLYSFENNLVKRMEIRELSEEL